MHYHNDAVHTHNSLIFLRMMHHNQRHHGENADGAARARSQSLPLHLETRAPEQDTRSENPQLLDLIDRYFGSYLPSEKRKLKEYLENPITQTLMSAVPVEYIKEIAHRAVSDQTSSRRSKDRSDSDSVLLYDNRPSPSEDGEATQLLEKHEDKHERKSVSGKLMNFVRNTVQLAYKHSPASVLQSNYAEPESLSLDHRSSLGSQLSDQDNEQSPYSSKWCSYCDKFTTHYSHQHTCRICKAIGQHRSAQCSSSTRIPSVSSIYGNVLNVILDPAIVSESVEKVMSTPLIAGKDSLLRQSLTRLGFWVGASQTPVQSPASRDWASSSSSSASDSSPLQSQDQSSLSKVLSYAEGRSLVPDSIMQYLRNVMHHEISTNAFDVVVTYNPDPRSWMPRSEMITPTSMPTTPQTMNLHQKHFQIYTQRVLEGARNELVRLLHQVHQKQLQANQQQVQ